MSIWEAVIYAIFGGIAEMLPISFSGHAVLLHDALHLPSLQQGGGFFVRASICVGVCLAIYLSFPSDVRRFSGELRYMTGLKKRKRGDVIDRVTRRSVVLGCIAFILSLISLFFVAGAERIERLLLVIVFFVLNAGFLYLCCRGQTGNKDEKGFTLIDAILIGLGRMLSVFPGVSALGTSMGIGRARGLALHYNLRIAFMLTFAQQIVLFFYYLIRGIAFGSFAGALILPRLLTIPVSAIFGYLAIQYFRYLLQRGKLRVFVYYCIEIAAVAAVLALINS